MGQNNELEFHKVVSKYLDFHFFYKLEPIKINFKVFFKEKHEKHIQHFKKKVEVDRLTRMFT